MEVGLTWALVLFLVAAGAGFVDAIAGGGGLITIPTLLLSGMPPASALATNKLQALAGSGAAALRFVRAGAVDLKRAPILAAFLGAGVGSLLVLAAPVFLTKLIPLVIALIGLYTLFAPKLDDIERPAVISNQTYRRALVPAIGFYDGYLGPGTGMFFAVAKNALRGAALVRATANAKVLNAATNLASLLVFIVLGDVYYQTGLLMMAGQTIGATLGSHLALKNGARFIRPVMVIMCFVMLARYSFF